MGCESSVLPSFEITEKEYSEFRWIDLSKDEVNKLAGSFAEIDLASSGSITLSELCSSLSLAPNKILCVIFDFLDGHHDKSMSFIDFVVNMWCFLTYMEDEMFEFAFKLYDTGRSGGLSKKELTEVLAILHGHNHVKENRFKSTVDEMWHVMNPGDFDTINVSQFVKHIRKYRSLIFPIFEVQVELPISFVVYMCLLRTVRV